MRTALVITFESENPTRTIKEIKKRIESIEDLQGAFTTFDNHLVNASSKIEIQHPTSKTSCILDTKCFFSGTTRYKGVKITLERPTLKECQEQLNHCIDYIEGWAE